MPAHLELMILFLVTVFIGYRLYSALGTRPDNEATSAKDNPIDQAAKRRKAENASKNKTTATTFPHFAALGRDPKALVAAADLQKAEPDFDPRHFLEGACHAFVKISIAFAQGEHEPLQKLLDPKLYKTFARAIDDRKKANQIQKLHIESISRVNLEEGFVKAGKLVVKVKFTSHQYSETLDKAGQTIEIEPPQAIADTLIDLWTFSRPIADPDNRWLLMETEVIDA